MRINGLFFKFCGVVSLLALAGCASFPGAELLEEPKPLPAANPLAETTDERIVATIERVIYRDGPGAWAKNVDWDEYLVRIENQGEGPIRITDALLIDSLGSWNESQTSLRELVANTRQNVRRYNGNGLEVKAGYPGRQALGTTAKAMGTGAAVGAITYSGTYFSAASAASAGAIAGALLVAPVLAVGGMQRSLSDSEVNEVIDSRQTRLPILLQAGEEQQLVLFFPLTPSPQVMQITYRDARGIQQVHIDTRTALDGLHLVSNTGSHH